MNDKKATKQSKTSKSTSSGHAAAQAPSPGTSSRTLPVEPPPRLLRDTKTTAAALVMLERGIKLLYQKDFRKARTELKALIEAYPAEAEIAAKARSYVQICDREEAANKKHTITNDQLYTLGVMEHNRGNFDGAISYFRQSLEQNRDAEHIHYSLAASLAQKGQAAEAIQALRRAIELNGDNLIYAKNDQDFASLHPNREFADLVGLTPSSGAALPNQS